MEADMNQHAEPARRFIAPLLAMPADSRHRKIFDAVAENHVSPPSSDQKTFWRPGS